ncbi:MAG: RNase adapter RapZ [Thermodesulfobacteriota bacterium]
MRLVILSGPSGSGKSTAANVLEDMNFFCVDNLPVALLPKFIELSCKSRGIAKLATVVDVREREFLQEFPATLKEIRECGHDVEIIYLETTDEALIKRFSETRRRHPLAPQESVAEGIKRERSLLTEIKEGADLIIDTTNFNVHQLKEAVRDHFSQQSAAKGMTLNLLSFGYRYGIPRDADMVMDVRFIPNPYFVDELRDSDGRDPAVSAFVNGKAESEGFVERFMALIDYLIPLYWREGKSYLTIAIGCTGGRHRSVSLANWIGETIHSDKCIVRVNHRDVEKL